ncbi:hypothetical protein [Bacillus thuringiensis]|uniref:Uncharacterized protein n=1 Tax=Bacillus thuringiensis TaxID=1428 RepID=A0A9X6WSD7_BACTU|nr:hypothetical protein [Bacillus thuringiensis]PFJ42734.1 hypothetical protein COJ15_05170 [Bacillus thuringiensis]
MTQTKTMKKTKRNVVLRNETTSSEGRGLELAMEFLDVLEGTTVWGKIRCLRKEYKDRREMMKKNNFKNETDDFRNTPFYYIDALSKLIRSLESETDKVYKSGDNVLVKLGDTWKKGVVSSYGMFSIKVATKNEELELHTLDILPYAKDIEEQIQLLTDWAEKGLIDASELEEIIESIKKSKEACDEEETEESDIAEEVHEEQTLPDEPVVDENTNKMALEQVVESPEEEEKEVEAEQQEEEKPEEEKVKEKEEEEIQKQSVEEIKTIEVTQTIVKRRGRQTIVDEQLSLFAM